LKGEVHLDIVGDGELRGQYEALAGKLGIDGRVTWHGHRPKPEVADLMRAADLFVLTSRYDSNPCVLIEALGSGLPVVATRVGGIPGMVGEADGLLAEPRDPQSIAGALETALAEPERFDRARIAAAARERYGLEAVGRAFAEAYDEAARLRGGTLPS
jgi:glycosyltransferase involved in cell wall biosynthesis